MDKSLYKNIIIYSHGNIGDILMGMPAFKTIRSQFPNSKIDILAVGNPSFQKEFLTSLNIFDNIFFMPTDPCGKFIKKSYLRLKIIKKILGLKYDTLFYMVSYPKLVEWFLFKLSKIRNRICLADLSIEKGNLKAFQIFLYGLKRAEFSCDTNPDQLPDFNFTTTEKTNAAAKFKSLNIPTGKIPFTVGIGANHPARIWPLGNYEKVLDEIIPKYNLFPVFIVSNTEKSMAEELLKHYQGATLTADKSFSPRELICCLTNFKFHLGNDTGTMHMAAAVGIPCIGIYAFNNAGKVFHPYGNNNCILQKDIICKGCINTPCCKQNYPAKCLQMITPKEVIEATMEFI